MDGTNIRFVSTPFIRDNKIETREYQQSILEKCKLKSTLVVLPTGLGKTPVAIMLIAHILDKKNGKILFLAPTKPLVNQHVRVLGETLTDVNITMFTGTTRPAKRNEMWKEANIIVSTPQVIRNDVMEKRYDLSEVKLLIFDEAHHATGDHAYATIGKLYRGKGLVLGMTASPGSNMEKITEICENIGVENVVIKSEDDPDVKPYVKSMNIRWKSVDLDERTKRAAGFLKILLSTITGELRSFGIQISKTMPSKRELLDIQPQLRAIMMKDDKPSWVYKAMSLQSEAMIISSALEYAETQGLHTLKKYVERLIEKGNSRSSKKSERTLLEREEFKRLVSFLNTIEYKDIVNNKINVLRDLIRHQIVTRKDSKLIIFANYRDTCEAILEDIKNVEGIKPVLFIGQGSRGGRKGMTQKIQAETIKKFENGEYNTLIATSVAEEGLDIPATDLVIFFEPIPSEIRYIQRRGRTARDRTGNVYILIYKSTRDYGYYNAALYRERTMKNELKLLRKALDETQYHSEFTKETVHDVNHKSQGGKTLFEFDGVYEKNTHDKKEDDPNYRTITVDNREFNSGVVEHLYAEGIKIKSESLPAGDYLTKETLLERKEASDFVSSILDGRLFLQLRKLKQSHPNPLVIIEGDIKTGRLTNNAVRGALLSIAIDFKVPVLVSFDAGETAQIIKSIIEKENKSGKTYSIRPSYNAGPEELQRFIVEGLPGISGTLALRLLEYFGSVRNIFNSPTEELMKVKGIGKKTAENIINILEKTYSGIAREM